MADIGISGQTTGQCEATKGCGFGAHDRIGFRIMEPITHLWAGCELQQLRDPTTSRSTGVERHISSGDRQPFLQPITTVRTR